MKLNCSVLFFILAFSITNCTRKAQETSNISFQLPTKTEIQKSKLVSTKVGKKIVTQSVTVPGFADLSHVVINISGPGIEPSVLCHYDLEHDGAIGGVCDFSSFPVVNVTVNPGLNRLIQLGLAFKDPDTDKLMFKYGDANKELKPGDDRVEIPLSDLGIGGEQGHVLGRYLTSPDSGPTGRLDVKIKPPGRPSLTLMRTEIFSGWFSAFSMSGVEFEYIVNDSFVLFGKPVSKTDFSSFESAGGPVDVSDYSDGYEVVGFFGDGPSLSGKTFSATMCPAAQAYISCLDSQSHFQGPFAQIAQSGQYLQFGANGNIQWALLPGVQNALTDLRILYNANVDPKNNEPFLKKFAVEDGLYNCNFLQGLPNTQVLANSIPVSQSSFVSGISNIPETALLAICPRAGSISFQSALTYPKLNSGGGDTQNPYFRFEVQTFSAFNGNAINMTSGMCYPVFINVFEYSQGNSNYYNLENGDLVISNLNSAWVEFHNNSSCSSLYSGSITIPTGSHTHSNQIWVKAIATGSNLQFSPTYTSSDSIEFSPSTNLVNVGTPQLIAIAPPKMVNHLAPPTPQMCYEVKVRRADASGIAISNGLPSLTVNFDMNGNYQYFSGLSDCMNSTGPNSTTGTTTIGSNNSDVTFYVKRIAVGLAPAPMSFSAVGFPVVNFSPEGSSGQSVGTQFIVSPVGPFELGRCNEFEIRHVNALGDDVPAPIAMTIEVRKSADEAQTFSDPMCSTSLTLVSLPGGSSRTRFFIQTTSTAGVSVVATHGALNSSATVFTPVPPANSYEPYLTFNLPKIKSQLLGSHDGFPRTISLTTHNFPGPIACEMADNPSYSSWTNCTGQLNLVNNEFTWSAADAVNKKGFRFVLQNGPMNKHYYFIPSKLYSKYGMDLEVKNCDVVLPQNFTSGLEDLESALPANTTLCLGSGTFAGDSSPSMYSISNKFLIGKTSATGEPDTFLTGLSSNSLFDALSNSSVANIYFASPGAGSNLSYIRFTTGSGTVSTYNNVYNIDAHYSKGILRSATALSLKSVGDRFIISGIAGNHSGVYFSCSGCSGSNFFYDTLFELSSSASFFAKGIDIYESGPTILIKNVKTGVANNNGTLLHSDQSSQTYMPSINIDDSHITFSGPSNLNRYGIFASNRISLTINKSVFINNFDAQTTIKTFSSTAGNHNLVMNDVKFVNSNDVSAVLLATTTYSQNISTNRVHFVRVGGGASTSPAINTTGAANHNWSTASTTQPKDTYFCGSAVTNWSSIHPQPFTGSFNSGAVPIVTNNINVGQLMCSH